MPDISMCPSTDCPLRTECLRNEASGTKPDGRRQSWAAFTWHSVADGAAILCDGDSPTRPPLRDRLLSTPTLNREEADRG